LTRLRGRQIIGRDANAADRRPDRHRGDQRARAGASLNQGISGSFGWPFRGSWQRAWVIGVTLVLLMPIAFIPVLGYSVACVRAARAEGPPALRFRGRLFIDGFWVTLALLLLTAPFALIAVPLHGVLHNPTLWHSTSTLLEWESWSTATLIVALPWGFVELLLMPHATARYAATCKARDLFDFAASLRGVRREFAAWNLAIATMVTAWAIGLACVALLCIGAVPGIFYAILVSAHAAATLHPEGESPATG
jgi:hypothetical protein